MIGFTEEEIRAGRPNISAKEAISFCLDRLIADKDKEMTEELAHHLTYEELIGSLLLAQDAMEKL